MIIISFRWGQTGRILTIKTIQLHLATISGISIKTIQSKIPEPKWDGVFNEKFSVAIHFHFVNIWLRILNLNRCPFTTQESLKKEKLQSYVSVRLSQKKSWPNWLRKKEQSTISLIIIKQMDNWDVFTTFMIHRKYKGEFRFIDKSYHKRMILLWLSNWYY